MFPDLDMMGQVMETVGTVLYERSIGERGNKYCSTNINYKSMIRESYVCA